MNDNEKNELLGSLKVPPLGEGEVDRIVEAAMPIPTSGSGPSSSWGGWWSHAAAVLVGVSLMALGRGCQEAKTELEIREVAVRVPVEVPVEVIVEVPVEVPVEVSVERLVEVPVEKIVERIVYRDRVVASERPSPPEAQAKAPRRVARSTGSQRTHLEVRRVDGRVMLRTRGSMADVIPVLIDALDSDDGAVVAAAADRLETVRAGFGARAVELRPSKPVRARRSGLRAVLSSGRTEVRATEMDDAELWREWWERQQALEGTRRLAASI